MDTPIDAFKKIFPFKYDYLGYLCKKKSKGLESTGNSVLLQSTTLPCAFGVAS